MSEATSRQNLKDQFSAGALPTEKNFANLIDSTLNIVDDCFQWSEQDGVQIRTRGPNRRMMSFFRTAHQQDRPDWSLTSNERTGSLHFVPVSERDPQAPANPADPGVVTLAYRDGRRVGIGVDEPAFDLDVAGVVKSSGRVGERGKVRADGDWKDITEDLTGCQAFEVMAGVGGELEKGRYALMHAYALNAYNPTGFFRNFLNWKKRIRCDHAWYRSRGDKLKLRWAETGQKFHYKLQLKTNSDFGAGYFIQYSLTRLWFDPRMDQSRIPPQQGANS